MDLPYHLLLGGRDWQQFVDLNSTNLVWNSQRCQLNLAPELARFPARPNERVYTVEDRRGAAMDCFGHIYWIDNAATAIHYRPAGSRKSARLWHVSELGNQCENQFTKDFRPISVSPLASPQLRGLTVTRRGYLVAGTLAPAGLLIIDLHRGGVAQWHRWPETIAFAPFDMTATADGGLWILDLPDSADPQLWYLDSSLRIGAPPYITSTSSVSDFRGEFHPADNERPHCATAGSAPRAIPLALSVPLTDVDAIAIEALPDGSILLLDRGPSGSETLLHRFHCESGLGPAIDLNQIFSDLFAQQAPIDGHDIAFVGDDESQANPPAHSHSGTLYVASAEGNQSFAFHLRLEANDLTATATTKYLPMRRFAGKGLVGGQKDVFYDQATNWLVLTELPRPRYAKQGAIVLGQLSNGREIFDGKQPQCQWHRLFIDACIPAGDGIAIETRAADDPIELRRQAWSEKQSPYLRTINRSNHSDDPNSPHWVDEDERPFHRPFNPSPRKQPHIGTWELLFQRAKGRYLELRITLNGSGRSSPKIRALRVYYPRLSYVQRFLPAVYQESAESAGFLERFLANFEGLHSELEARIASAQILFDSRTVPEEALDWLAGWLGAFFEDNWDYARRRLFLKHAITLYRQRGTSLGLINAIRIATEACPDDRLFDNNSSFAPFAVRIVERFSSRSLANNLAISASSALQLGTTNIASPWQPSQGRTRLNTLWYEYLLDRYVPGNNELTELISELNNHWQNPPVQPEALVFAPLTPDDPVHAADRRHFLRRYLASNYADLNAEDSDHFQDFLRRKYATVSSLKIAYGISDTSPINQFSSVPMPTADLPADGPALYDWIQFATVDVHAARGAHRFTVLVPVQPGQGPQERQKALEQVRSVVERERPSHTGFDVKLYWALFRVGSARTGVDTVLGEGSRFTSLVLDAGYIGEGLLEEHHPWNFTDRWVSGRDSPGSRAIG